VGEALPHPFRDIPFAQRFKKYQHLSLEAERHSGDKRPETFRPNVDTLEPGDVVLPKKTWNERKRFVEPLLVDSTCDVLQKQLERRHLSRGHPTWRGPRPRRR